MPLQLACSEEVRFARWKRFGHDPSVNNQFAGQLRVTRLRPNFSLGSTGTGPRRRARRERQRPWIFSGLIGKIPDFELSLACGLSGGTASTANEHIAQFGIFCKKSGVFC